MFELSVPWWELVARAIIVYLSLIIFIRVTGKRQIGQLSPFDLVLLLILSEAVQNAMTAGDESVAGGLIVVATLLAINYLIGFITYKSRKAEDIIEGRPEILIRDGKLIEQVAQKSRISERELESTLREAGFFKMEDVRLAVLEDNGSVSVEGYDKGRKTKPKVKKDK